MSTKKLIFILLLIPIQTRAQPLTLTITDIDSLRFFPRDTILNQIAKRQYVDQQLRQHHLRELLTVFARLNALNQELTILHRQETNLALIHRLNLEKQKRSEISDLDVLQSEQNLLGKRLDVISHLYQIRETILTLARLANIRIEP